MHALVGVVQAISYTSFPRKQLTAGMTNYIIKPQYVVVQVYLSEDKKCVRDESIPSLTVYMCRYVVL